MDLPRAINDSDSVFNISHVIRHLPPGRKQSPELPQIVGHVVRHHMGKNRSKKDKIEGIVGKRKTVLGG